VGTSPEELDTPALLNRNDFAVFREAVGHRWIPVVHGAGEVLVEYEGTPAALPKRR
jgi:hypothetical protein